MVYKIHKLIQQIFSIPKLLHGHYSLSRFKGLGRLVGAICIKLSAPFYSQLGFKRTCRWCPCCNWRGKHFLPYIAEGYVGFNIECPSCKSHPRHRGHILLYQRTMNFPNKSGKVLYFAPEKGILPFFKSNLNLEVLTADLYGDNVDYNFDIMDIPLKSETFDYIVCHHVIEHVSDDRKAMKELYKILKPGGSLILSVPINPHLLKTIDFGKPNHLIDGHYYEYALDFEERIPKEFQVTRIDFFESFNRPEREELGLDQNYVYVCMKPKL